MRQRITKTKTLKKLSSLIGNREIEIAITRGNTHSRVDIKCKDGTKWSIWPNGIVYQWNLKKETI